MILVDAFIVTWVRVYCTELKQNSPPFTMSNCSFVCEHINCDLPSFFIVKSLNSWSKFYVLWMLSHFLQIVGFCFKLQTSQTFQNIS
jgi:hypothetical protein